MPFQIDMPPRDTLTAGDLMDPGVVDAIKSATDDGIAVTIRPVTWAELATLAGIELDVPDADKAVIIAASNGSDERDDG